MARGRNAAAQKYAEDQKRNEERLAAGLVSERFPQVSGMQITMHYYQDQPSLPLMVRTVNVYPSSYAFFHMKCVIKECKDGGFDLGPAIRAMVRDRKRSGSGELLCRGKGERLPKRHASVTYEVKIRYRKAAK